MKNKNTKKRLPWNKGQLVGDKLPFSYEEVRSIKEKLREKNDLKGFVLFAVAIDSSLRSGDLLSLKGKDMRSKNGMIKQEVVIFMEKTGKKITFSLFKETRDYLLKYMIKCQIEDNDFLFKGRFTGTHLSKDTFRRFIKSCAELIGLNPEHYSGHSTRRTRVIHLALKGMADTLIAELIGVRVETVRYYIRRVALQMSKKFPM